MKPRINGTEFGSITIEGETIEYDVIIRLNGEVKKRKKKLSKAVYGTSHIVSLEEAKYVYEKGAKQIIVGCGQNKVLKLSKESEDYFKKKDCSVELLSTPKAIQSWNKSKKGIIGLFHITC